jgi:hypothetical protein
MYGEWKLGEGFSPASILELRVRAVALDPHFNADQLTPALRTFHQRRPSRVLAWPITAYCPYISSAGRGTGRRSSVDLGHNGAAGAMIGMPK